MDNSLLVSLSQQLAALRAIDVIANNIANASTPGFKREASAFEEYVSRMRPAEGEMGTQMLSFVKDAGTLRDTAQGQMNQTGAPFDLAINGKGFFTVQTAAGMRYTRDGHFTLDAAGQIVDSAGNPLQGDSGAITITPDDTNVQIGPDGTISATVNGLGTQIGKLQLVDFADEHLMRKEGGNLYSTDQAATPTTDATIGQGMLEASNVNIVEELVDMIECQRAYEINSKMVSAVDDMLRNANQTL